MIGLEKLAYDNRAALEPLVWLVVSAVVVTMPEPGSKFSWSTLYRWLYDALHQFSNMKRPTPAAQKPPEKA